MESEKSPAKILITGASGLVGKAFKDRLVRSGIPFVELSHRPRSGAITADFDSGKPAPPEIFAGVTAVVHLAGAPVGRRWTDKIKTEILDSRVRSTKALAEGMAALPADARPSVFVSMSGSGIYGIARKEPRLDEKAAIAPPGESFLADVSREWEESTRPAEAAGIRTIRLRTGAVLDKRGGALAKMLPAFLAGLGGPVGDGRQRMAWITLEDLVALIFFILRTPGVSGPLNAVAPHTVTNADFALALGSVLNRPAVIRTPAFALKMIFGRMAAETILADAAPFPAKAMEAGFEFRHPELTPALEYVLHG